MRALKGSGNMTKARARQRAKAGQKAGQKAKKRQETADQPGPGIRPGQFDPGSGSITGPRVGIGAQHAPRTKRGSARSR